MTGKVSRNSNGRLEKQMANNSVTKSAIQLNSTQLNSTQLQVEMKPAATVTQVETSN